MRHPSIVHRSPSTFLSPGRCDFTKQQQAAKMTMYASDQNAFFNSSISGFRGYDQDFDMEEDNFTDALEHQTQCDMNEQDFNTKLPDTKATSEAYTPTTTTFAQDPPMFGESILKTKPLTHPKHYNPLAEPEETIRVNKYSASDKHTAAYHSIFKTSPNSFQDQSQSQHNSGCSGSRGASTPPATPRPRDISATDPEPELGFEPKPEGTARVWLGPDDLRDVAKPFLREKRWHEKVAHLHPSIPLASHRYWIGVLNPDQKPKYASKETHFTWMKGNRLTTVETVRKIYAATTMHEGVFIMGGERPEDGDRMEELDLFNDKVVLFKIVEEGTPEAKGRLITEGLVAKEMEVIELDD
jgi:hypothetical protein